MAKENLHALIVRAVQFVPMVKKKDIAKYVMGQECVGLIGVKLQ
jgi:hypothetical protein